MSTQGRRPADEPRDAEIERLLGDLPRPAASAAFRARSREQFLAVDGAREAQVAPSGPRQVPVRTRAFPFVWPLVIAASIAFVLFFVMSRDSRSRWSVVETAAGAHYKIDELPVDDRDPARLLDLLQTARQIETADAGLVVRLSDQFLVELGPHTKVSGMSFPAAGMYSIRAESGSLRVCTGPGFSGNRLRILTDHMESSVVGTVFGLDVEAAGTCLCCAQGVVKCDPRDGGGSKPVEAGQMCFAYPTGKAAARGAAVEEHLEPLRRLQERAATIWQR